MLLFGMATEAISLLLRQKHVSHGYIKNVSEATPVQAPGPELSTPKRKTSTYGGCVGRRQATQEHEQDENKHNGG